MIAKSRREAVMGVKALLLRDMGCYLEERWANERDYTTNVVRGAKAEVEAAPRLFYLGESFDVRPVRSLYESVKVCLVLFHTRRISSSLLAA